MKNSRFSNVLNFPANMVRRAADDAAFAAARAFGAGLHELALPKVKRSRSVSDIHRDVLRAQHIASSLATKVA